MKEGASPSTRACEASATPTSGRSAIARRFRRPMANPTPRWRNMPFATRNISAVVQHRPPEPFVFRSLGTMAALGHSRAVAQVMGVRITGFFAWWFRRTYYLMQMPRWDRRLRIIVDWTIALFFRHDITKVDLAVEHDQILQDGGGRAEAQRAERPAKRLQESIA